MLSFLWLIGGLIILGIVLILVLVVIPSYIKMKWITFKHPDYDRTLSATETKFIENAREVIHDLFFKPSPEKKWYSILYVIAFIPMMLAVWGVLGWAGYSVYILLNQNAVLPDDVIVSHGIGFGVSAVMAVFAGGAFAFWLLYLFLGYFKGKDQWSLNAYAGITKEKKDEILNYNLNQIEHAVRVKRLNTNSPFSVMDFLGGINRRFKKYTGYSAYILMGITCVFFVFDMRYRTTFFKDHIVYNHYWSGKKTTVPYGALSYVEAECAFGSKGAMNVSLRYSAQEKDIVTIEINYWIKTRGLERLSELDEVLRTHKTPFKKSTRQPPGKDIQSAYLETCFNKLSVRLPNERYQTIRKILHADELAAD